MPDLSVPALKQDMMGTQTQPPCLAPLCCHRSRVAKPKGLSQTRLCPDCHQLQDIPTRTVSVRPLRVKHTQGATNPPGLSTGTGTTSSPCGGCGEEEPLVTLSSQQLFQFPFWLSPIPACPRQALPPHETPCIPLPQSARGARGTQLSPAAAKAPPTEISGAKASSQHCCPAHCSTGAASSREGHPVLPTDGHSSPTTLTASGQQMRTPPHRHPRGTAQAEGCPPAHFSPLLSRHQHKSLPSRKSKRVATCAGAKMIQ